MIEQKIVQRNQIDKSVLYHYFYFPLYNKFYFLKTKIQEDLQKGHGCMDVRKGLKSHSCSYKYVFIFSQSCLTSDNFTKKIFYKILELTCLVSGSNNQYIAPNTAHKELMTRNAEKGYNG